MNAFGFLAFAAASLGALWVGIDVGREPPMVLAEGPWVEGCERVGETLRVEVAEDAPDLRFDFVGLPEGAEVGYEAFDAAGAPLGGGMGMWVPLSRWEGVRTVAFYGVDGADFSAVRRVSSRVDGGRPPRAPERRRGWPRRGLVPGMGSW